MELAEDLQARGTPHFFVNGHRLSGAQPYEEFKKLIDEQLKIAKGLVENGVASSNVYATLMARAAPAPELETRSVSLPAGVRPSRGPADAKVVIREFSDFQCPFCGRVQGTLQQLLADHPKDVRIEFRHFPLPFHQDAQLAAEAAVEVFAQKGNAGFWAYHDLLFANQSALKPADLVTYAQQVGVNLAQFNAALDDRRHRAVVEADSKAATEGGIMGTPAFLVNDYFISGAQPPRAFEKAIKRVASGKSTKRPPATP
jgi:protein-disulfide isomerase